MDEEDLVGAVQQFMEQATLGDYVSRLTLLLAFHCQALHMPQTEYQGKYEGRNYNTAQVNNTC
jgi:hypothetical protein